VFLLFTAFKFEGIVINASANYTYMFMIFNCLDILYIKYSVGIYLASHKTVGLTIGIIM